MTVSVILIVRDMEKSFLYLTVVDEESLLQLQGVTVGYRIIIKPQQGQKVLPYNLAC
ncbi:hypothetical protein [uncultured Paraglaciecola sp.]|jgi:hypothetical protein|uniref:hypothetical protein n=1 Tax=uncultured Paraglaciecola sp. TaxID=1765024 RepID=UPI00263061F8|nr:hypothetical protein [uncultured Paraglaciecola sp.]